MRHILRVGLFGLLLMLGGAVAHAQEIGSEISGGGGGSSSVGPGTAGAIPKFASTTTLGDSKLVTSGTNGGTLTLYDDTAVTGVSKLILQSGDGQGSNSPLLTLQGVVGTNTILKFIPGGGGSARFDFGSSGGSIQNTIYSTDGTSDLVVSHGAGFTTIAKFSATNGLIIGTGDDLGLARASAGVLKVTDGSSGDGSLYVGISIQGWQTKTLTESAATGFVEIPLAQNTVIGGFVEYVVRTTNGTDYSVESGQLFFTGASKTNGTVDDADVGLVGTPVQSTTAANTFTNQFTVTKGTNKITLNCQSDSTLTSTDTITLFYRVHLNGAQTETITGL